MMSLFSKTHRLLPILLLILLLLFFFFLPLSVAHELNVLRRWPIRMPTPPSQRLHADPDPMQPSMDLSAFNTTYAYIDEMNEGRLFGTLEKIVQMPCFQLFSVDLVRPCRQWIMDEVCGGGACQLCTGSYEDVVVPESIQAGRAMEKTSSSAAKCGVEGTTIVDGMNQKTLLDDWMMDAQSVSEGKDSDIVVVNLRKNPEGNTKFAGKSAKMVWDAIFEQNCFQDEFSNLCHEEKLLHRMLHAFRTSVSTHVARNFIPTDPTKADNVVPKKEIEKKRAKENPFDIPTEKKGAQDNEEAVVITPADISVWGDFVPNLDMFERKMMKMSDQERSHVHYSLAVLLRAWSVIGETVLHEATKCQSIPDNAELEQILSISHEMTYDGDLIRPELGGQVMSVLRNISDILDCVGCTKCKMWSKLQLRGIQTAIRILLAESHGKMIRVAWNDVVALVNTMHQFSFTIEALKDMKGAVIRMKISRIIGYGILGSITLFAGFMIFMVRRRWRKSKKE